jgi:sugar lactone lactonase YvrE
MREYVAHCATTERYRLAEGPVWDVDDHRLLWVDISAGDVHIGELRGDAIVPTATHHVDTTVGAVALGHGGSLLVAGHQCLYQLDEAGEAIEVTRLVEEGQARRLNDGKCDPEGRFLVGTLALGDDVGETLYQVDSERGTAIIDDDLQLSNGLGWSPDGHTLYSVDTTPGLVFTRPYDPDSGRWGERATAFHLGGAFPDGLCVDAEGNLWVAVWGAGEVRHLTPDGELLGVVRVAAPYTSCVTFAGPGLDRLVITTAIDDLSTEQLAAHPESGGVFIADVEARGLPSSRWRR